MLGVNWNRASADAVQALQLLTRETRQIESRVSSGLKVSDPRDNGAVYAIAMGQKSRIASHVSIAEGISRARGLIDVSLASGSAIARVLGQMKVAASAARSDDLNADQRLALQSDYDALRSQIDQIASSARFNGVNLSAAGGTDIDVVLSDGGSSGTIQQIRTANSSPVLGAPVRVSTGVAGAEIPSGVGLPPALSGDGRFAAFDSFDSGITPGDTNGYSDVFLKDTQTGAISLVSTDAAGGLGNANSGNPVLSPDGRYLLFSSGATNLVAGDTNDRSDVFLKDLQTGVVTRISTDSAGNQATGGAIGSGSTNASFSPDGQSVLFLSTATNLVAGDTNGLQDVFLKNLQTGDVTRVSTDASGGEAVGGGTFNGHNASMSADGRYVFFTSAAANLVSGDTNGSRDIFRKDLQTGEVSRVSTSASGAQGDANSFTARVSSDGRFIVFSSLSSNMVSGDTNGVTDIFLKDMLTGDVTRVSTTATGAQSSGGTSVVPSLTPDGRFLLFEGTANNLVPGDTNAQSDVFLKDLKTGSIVRVSTDAAGVQGDYESSSSVLSADGRFIGFLSRASNLVTGDTNGDPDLFVRELSTVSSGIVPGLSAYVVGNGGVTAADDTQFRIDGTLIGTVDITATMTVADYLEAVSTATGGRVSARYDADAGEFTYETAAMSGGQGVLTLTSAGTARSWLGHGLFGSNTSSGQGGVITLEDQDWTVGGAGALSGVSSASGQLLSASGASVADAAIDTALTVLNGQMALLGAKAKAIEVQDRFNVSFVSTMEKNLSNLVDADLARESARLQSLQIKQQLGAQALSIANQAPQMILSLFRG